MGHPFRACRTAGRPEGRPLRIARRLEFRRQRLALPREDAGVAADGDEPAAEHQPVARVRLDRREDAGELAAPHDAPDRVVDRPTDVGMRRVAEMTEVGREIARADEQPVDAVDRRDRLQVPPKARSAFRSGR